jgi:hypothetical protein
MAANFRLILVKNVTFLPFHDHPVAAAAVAVMVIVVVM